MNPKIIYEELLSNIEKFFPGAVSMPLFISTKMASGNCHFIVPYIKSCLENSKIVNAKLIQRNGKEKAFLHSWVEKDGFEIDATTQSILPVECREKEYRIENKRTAKTLEEYWKIMPNFKPFLVTDVDKYLKEEPFLIPHLISVYQGIINLNCAQDLKDILLDELSKSIDLSILKNNKDYDSSKLKKISRGIYPKSFLFSDKHMKITRNDIRLFGLADI